MFLYMKKIICLLEQKYDSMSLHGFISDIKIIVIVSKLFYNIPGACLLNRSPVPAMVLKSNRSGLLMV